MEKTKKTVFLAVEPYSSWVCIHTYATKKPGVTWPRAIIQHADPSGKCVLIDSWLLFNIIFSLTTSYLGHLKMTTAPVVVYW